METPKIGDGATVHIGSDSYGCTVVESVTGFVTVQYDTTTPGEGHDYYSNQVWVHTPNPNGAKKSFRWATKQKCWRYVEKNAATGRWTTPRSGYRLVTGKRHSHVDPTF
jgi:hypothetical protein